MLDRLDSDHSSSKTNLSTDIPSSAQVALQDKHWKLAMMEEYNALLMNNTWSLVPPHPDLKVVGNKWVFKIKYNQDGTISRFKARLVAKGFHQTPGIDFSETFSPVVKAQTIRTVMSIAICNGWEMQQIDINNAFLNGDLSEDVFMWQPEGFEDKDHPHYICKLNKALYGLKQAPRAWFGKYPKSATFVVIDFTYWL